MERTAIAAPPSLCPVEGARVKRIGSILVKRGRPCVLTDVREKYHESVVYAEKSAAKFAMLAR